ncbi:MAG: hypothetical protein COB41_00290 [Proteobacteria bacterium]|nr:MAG: hypothetical protein COB41_00290 [Pseudomonadota bacterium]
MRFYVLLLLIVPLFIVESGMCYNFGTDIAPHKYSNTDIIKMCAKSIYKDSPTKVLLDKKYKELKKQLPENVVYTIKYAYPISKLLIDKKIEYKWEF